MSYELYLLFPGQGSQYVGMGSKLKTKSILETANQKLGFSISNMMLNGPIEELTLTANTQPAIVAYSYGLFLELNEILKEKNINIAGVLGHSVGEYSALSAAGAISIEDAIFAVNKRGQYMQAAVSPGVGKMIALLKVPSEMIEVACKESSSETEKVMPANFNEPNQTVISGHAAACDRAVEYLKEKLETPFRAVELKVSAPFHSELMKPAAEELKKELDDIRFSNLNTPYVANIDATKYEISTESEIIKSNLVKQVAGSVRWTQSIQSLPANARCIEVGPGKVLTGLMRKINREIPSLALDAGEAFDKDKILEFLV